MDSKTHIPTALLLLLLLGGFFVFYFFNPSQSSFFLPCPFKLATGYHCPGCGSQRALHLLAHLNIAGAFSMNPLMVLSLPLIGYGLGTKLYNNFFGTQHRVNFFYQKWFVYGYFGLALLYWVLRNIPYPPFTYLAPTETCLG